MEVCMRTMRERTSTSLGVITWRCCTSTSSPLVSLRLRNYLNQVIRSKPIAERPFIDGAPMPPKKKKSPLRMSTICGRLWGRRGTVWMWKPFYALSKKHEATHSWGEIAEPLCATTIWDLEESSQHSSGGKRPVSLWTGAWRTTCKTGGLRPMGNPTLISPNIREWLRYWWSSCFLFL